MSVLSEMTPEWSRTANDITLYVLRARERNEAATQVLSENPMELYNAFTRERGANVPKTEMALWCVDYIVKCVKMPLKTLRKAAIYDGLISG